MVLEVKEAQKWEQLCVSGKQGLRPQHSRIQPGHRDEAAEPADPGEHGLPVVPVSMSALVREAWSLSGVGPVEPGPQHGQAHRLPHALAAPPRPHPRPHRFQPLVDNVRPVEVALHGFRVNGESGDSPL